MEPASEAAAIVRRIFAESADAGQSFKGIAEMLNAECLPSPRGGKWSAGTIRSILQNKTYTGILTFNQRAFKKDRRTGRRVYTMNPREKWIVMDRPDLAIIPRPFFDRPDLAIIPPPRRPRARHAAHIPIDRSGKMC